MTIASPTISHGAVARGITSCARSTILGCQCVVSGEHKDRDTFRGEPAEDTGITSVFLGPRIVAARGRLSGEVAAEFPVVMDNTALQVVPDYRLRGSFALSW